MEYLLNRIFVMNKWKHIVVLFIMLTQLQVTMGQQKQVSHTIDSWGNVIAIQGHSDSYIDIIDLLIIIDQVF